MMCASIAVQIIPGSHKWQRAPANMYGEPLAAAQDMVPVEAPAGSVFLFHGNVWHGAFDRQQETGLRVSCNAYYCQGHIRRQENFEHSVPREVIDRNPLRFGQLLGFDGGAEGGTSCVYLRLPASLGCFSPHALSRVRFLPQIASSLTPLSMHTILPLSSALAAHICPDARLTHGILFRRFTDRRGPIPLRTRPGGPPGRDDPSTWDQFANGDLLHPPAPRL
jgi:hypothetical protein